MVDLKGMDKGSLKELFDIRKRGHLDRLVLGIKKLQNPDEGELIAKLHACAQSPISKKINPKQFW